MTQHTEDERPDERPVPNPLGFLPIILAAPEPRPIGSIQQNCLLHSVYGHTWSGHLYVVRAVTAEEWATYARTVAQILGQTDVNAHIASIRESHPYFYEVTTD